MSLKMQVQKYKNFSIPPKDFLANFGFPLAKVAKTQSLFHVSREFTRIFFSQSRKEHKAFPRITRIYTNLFKLTTDYGQQTTDFNQLTKVHSSMPIAQSRISFQKSVSIREIRGASFTNFFPY